MRDIGKSKPGTTSKIDPRRALKMRAEGMTWDHIGWELAGELGRRVPFTGKGVVRAIHDAGLWDERPR